jgi:NAD(P)-dependent dehydrogenase (short-subunit alcohol dehydrogenase family)
MDLNGAVAIVTGAGRGIGRELAVSLGKRGCKVVLASRTAAQVEEAAREIAAAGGEALAVPVDLGETAGVRGLMRATLDRFGTVDILVNNAAVLPAVPFLDITEEEWDATLAINLKGPFLLSQAALRVMAAKRSGYIVNISSTAALTVPGDIATYGISKKGLIGLSEALYAVGKEYGVKVSTIYPGMTDTPMLRGHISPPQPERWMQPEDIAGCILFLLEQSERVVVKDVVPWAVRCDVI